MAASATCRYLFIKKFKMLYRIILAALLCGPNLFLRGQTALAIGEVMPDTKISYTLNDTIHPGSLPDKRYPLTILDFWATWCSSCIKALPKIETLQTAFSSDVQFVLVNSKSTRDNAHKVADFFLKWKTRTGKGLAVASVTEDSLLEKLFPHNLVPHYVWIDRAGKVIAFSSAEELTADNILSVLRGNGVSFSMKKDQDKSRPLFSSDDLPREQLLSYRVFVKGKFDGLSSGSRVRYTGDTLHGRAMTNMTVKEMYLAVLRELYPGFTENRMVVALKDTGGWTAPEEETARAGWMRRHAYSLEVIVPPVLAGSLYQEVLGEINRSSGYHGVMERRTVDCYVLRVAGNTDKLVSHGKAMELRLFGDGRPYLINAPVKYLVSRLNNCAAVALPVVDETGMTAPIDIEFPRGLEELSVIQSQLRGYGLRLEKTERALEVFVVRERE